MNYEKMVDGMGVNFASEDQEVGRRDGGPRVRRNAKEKLQISSLILCPATVETSYKLMV